MPGVEERPQGGIQSLMLDVANRNRYPAGRPITVRIPPAQVVVGQLLQAGLDFIDPINHRADFLHVAVVLRRKNFSEQIHGCLSTTLVKTNGYATRRTAQRQSETIMENVLFFGLQA